MLRFSDLLRRWRAPGRNDDSDAELRRQKVDEVWSVTPETKTEESGWYWMQHEMVRDRINILISGSRHIDAYGRLSEFLAEGGYDQPLGNCVSLGCGFGGLERDLTRRGLISEIDAYDLSAGAIAEARRLAAEHGYHSIRYHAADFEALVLPTAAFNAVFAYSSVHHVDALEKLFVNVRRALKPGGLFHLNEFVGPSRFQWTDLQMNLINSYLDTLPDQLRQTPTGRKPHVQRPTVEQMIAANSSEAVRSSDIRDVLCEEFEIVEERPFGGTLLHMGLAGIAQNFDMSNAEDVAHLQRFFDLEDQAITNGSLRSDFSVLTAVPLTRPRLPGRLGAGKPPLFGMPPIRQLRPPAGLVVDGVNLTVSKADTMLGDSDGHYLSVGQSALAAIERVLGGTEPRNILDLPCGFGRVTRALRARFPQAAITVSDLDRPGVDFSAQTFDARAAYSVRDFRQLDLGETFDLIWVGSLITHLPAEQTRHLFSALARHLSAQGVALVTLQGPSLIDRLRATGYGLSAEAVEAVIEQFWQTGFGFEDYEGGKELYGVSLSNDHYGISLTGEPWIRASLAQAGLHLKSYEVQAWDDHHDIAVARLES